VKAAGEATLERRSVVAELLEDRGDLLLVTGLGSPSYDAMAAGDTASNFYLWGAMGSAVMVGLGLALARPESPVLVITGDGEMLMGLGALATAGAKKPKNLSIAVLDNGRYGETGMQLSHTSFGISLAGIAEASNFDSAGVIEDIEGVTRFRQQLQSDAGPRFAQILIKVENPEKVLPPRDGVFLKNRFRSNLGFPPI
jgi:thiamine pyrophosphate-dependent acetolactate synthase large subunit-like protein